MHSAAELLVRMGMWQRACRGMRTTEQAMAVRISKPI